MRRQREKMGTDSLFRQRTSRRFHRLAWRKRWLSPFFLVAIAAAHDIPADVTAQVFVKPAGDRLQLLVRVPLKAIRDVEFPERPGGYLDTGALYPRLEDAATLWIAQFVELYEDGTRLLKPAVAVTQLSLESDRSFASFDEARAHVTGP